MGAGGEQASSKRQEGQQQQQQLMVIDDGRQQYQLAGSAEHQHQSTSDESARAGQPAGNQDGHQQQQQQQQVSAAPETAYSHQPGSTTMDGEPREGFGSTIAFVGGAQVNHQTPSGGLRHSRPPPEAYGSSTSGTSASPEHGSSSPLFGYAKLDRDQQQQHLDQQRAQHQAQLAELANSRQQQAEEQQYQTTTPSVSLTTASEQQQQQELAAEQRAEQEARQEQQQQQQQAQHDSLLINPDAPIQMPVLEQQSLIHDQGGHESAVLTSTDDAKAGHHQGQQPAAIYQVYQAYYAPKDHKPLPGYIRLSLDEFNELFKDAEIQFVDKNLNGLAANLMGGGGGQQQVQQGHMVATAGNEQQTTGAYEAGAQHQDHMRASGSELQSIVVDRRSIGVAERRSSLSATANGTATATAADSSTTIDNKLSAVTDKKLRQLGRAAVKKIISIRNSRQAAKQETLLSESGHQNKAATAKLVMKRVKSQFLSATTQPSRMGTNSTANSTVMTSTSTTSTTTMPASSTQATTGPAASKSAGKTSQIMPKKKSSAYAKSSGDDQRRDKLAAAPATAKALNEDGKKSIAG
jgi:hypothetical protein